MINTTRVDMTQCPEPFRTDVQDLLSGDPATWVVTEAYRSPEQQAIDWQKGRDADGIVIDEVAVITNAKSGESPHNHALAVDVTLVVDGKDVWDYNDPSWLRLYAKIDAHPRLHSGIHFPEKDGDHIEAVRWRQLIPQSEGST